MRSQYEIHRPNKENREIIPGAQSYLLFVADDIFTEESLHVCNLIQRRFQVPFHPTILLRGTDRGFVREAVSFCKENGITMGNHFNPFGAPPWEYKHSQRGILGYDGVYARKLAAVEGDDTTSLRFMEQLRYETNVHMIIDSLEEEYDVLGKLLGEEPQLASVHLDCYKEPKFLAAWALFTQRHPHLVYRFRHKSAFAAQRAGTPLPNFANRLCPDDTIDEFNRSVGISREDVVRMIGIKEQCNPGYGAVREVVTHLDQYSKDRWNQPDLDPNHMDQWRVFLDPKFWHEDMPAHNWQAVSVAQVKALLQERIAL